MDKKQMTACDILQNAKLFYFLCISKITCTLQMGTLACFCRCFYCIKSERVQEWTLLVCAINSSLPRGRSMGGHDPRNGNVSYSVKKLST